MDITLVTEPMPERPAAPQHRRRRLWLTVAIVSVLATAGAAAVFLLREPAGTGLAVILDENATTAQKAAVAEYLNGLDLVGDVRFISGDEAIQRQQRDVPGLAVGAGGGRESFEFYLADPGDVGPVTEHLTEMPGVRSVGRAYTPPTLDAAHAGDLGVFLAVDITAEQRAAVEAYLKSQRTTAVHFVTREEAYEEFKVLFTGAPDLVDLTKPESLPESFRVTLADPSDLDRVRTHLEAMPGVEQVNAYRDIFSPRR